MTYKQVPIRSEVAHSLKTRFRAALALTLMLLVSPAALGAVQELDGTIWYGDGDCLIDEIDFYGDGTLDISFDGYFDFDTGYWDLTGGVLRISLDTFYDVFIARVDGDRIRAAHSWMVEGRKSPRTETCTFHQ